MQFKDYYQTLGVERDATQDQIKQAYRRLARKYHPDVSTEADAEEQFKTVGEAYEVLKDPEKRAAYDQLGSQWQAGQEFRPPPGWDEGFEFTTDDGAAFSDFFETLFGHARTGPRRSASGFKAAGRDHHARVSIDLEDAYHGASRYITLQAPEIDESGHLTTRERTLNVRIPKGIEQGQYIRLAGQGDPGLGGGRAGDLYLEVEFKPHPLFRVDGRDVHMDLPVAPWELALGSEVRAPTPAGKVDVKVPPGSQPGNKLRLSGRGLPGKKPGDFFVTLKAVLPPVKSDADREIYRNMRSTMAFDPRERLNA